MNETGQVKIRNPLTIITRKNWLILIGLLLLLTAVGVWAFAGTIMTELAVKGIVTTPGTALEIHQPDRGLLTGLSVTEGSYVSEGDPLARIYVLPSAGESSLPDLETMKKESKVITSPLDGYVALITENLWQELTVSDSIMTICEDNQAGISHVLALVSPDWLDKITDQTRAIVNIEGSGTQAHGGILATVVSVGETALTKQDIRTKTGRDDELTAAALTDNITYGVLLELELADDGSIVLRDGSVQGNDLRINSECMVTFILDESHPYERLFARLE